MAGPFDAYLEQKKQQEAAMAAQQVRMMPQRPDEVASGLATARELGEAPGKVLAFQDHFADLLAQKRATTALTGAPKMSDWIRTDPAGPLAKDDLDNLSWWEKGFRQFAGVGGAMLDNEFGRGVKTGVTGAKQIGTAAATVPIAGMQATLLNRLDAYDRAAQIDPGAPRHEIAAQLGIDPMSPEAGMMADFVAGDADKRQWHVDRATRLVTSNKDLMGALTDRVKAYQDEMKATQGRVVNFTDIEDVKGFGDWLGFNLGQAGPYLLATALAGMAAGPVGVVGAGYGMGVGDIRAEQITDGQDPFDMRATGAAVLGAVPYAGLELLGPAARPFRGVSGEALQQVAEGWMKRLGRDIGESAVEEFINEAGQEIIKDYAIQFGGGDDVVLDDETLLKWFNSGMAGLASGAGYGGAASAVSIAAEKEAARVESAGGAAGLLDQVSAQAQASKVRERSPEAFKAALDRAGRGDDLVFVPAQGLREFFQARDLDFDAEMAEAWGVDLDTLAQMELSGGRVAVPMSNFAAHLAGTDAEAWVRENATLDPDEVSLADAALFNDAVQDDLQMAFEQEQAATRDERLSVASDQQVFDGLYSQLRGAGRTADVAQNEARVMAAYFRSMAARIGEDSLDLARRFGLRIQGPDAPGIPRRRGALDVMLNDLRSGRKEQVGRTLTEFVIDAGGVQDTGGDVAALEGPQGLVGESREEIRARQAQATLGGMPATGKGLALDELGRKAVEAGYFPELMGETQGLNDGEAADLGRAVLDALREEASGRPRYIEGEGPDPARAALNEALQARALDPATMTNDQIAAALEAGESREYGQSAIPEGAVRMWRHGLQRVLSGDAAQSEMVGMGRPSLILKDAGGLADRPLQFMAGKIRKVMAEHPEISASVLEKIAPRVHDPDYILQSATDADSIVSVPVELPDGRVLIVTIRKNQRDAQGRPINLITSIYLKDDPQWLAREASANRLIYARDGYRSTGQSPNQPGSNSPYVQPRRADLTRPSKRRILSRADVFKGREFEQTRRGSIQFPASGPAGGETIISLFEKADLSTVIHEAGHFFLEATDTLAREPGAPQALLDEMAAVRAYLGAEDGAAFTTEQHETFARSFEAYVMEGKAPSLELADVFGRMKAWLTRIYRSIVGLNVPINDEIRGVFDRMLATDSEIAQARAEVAADPLFRERPAGMTDGDWSAYQRLARRSREQAEAKLLDKTMERVRREKQSWWKAERKQVRADVEAQMNAQPRFRLVEAMANGRFLMADGERAAPDMRLDRRALVGQFGDGVLAELSRQKLGGKRAVYGDEGMTPQAAADMFGWGSAAAMVEDLQNSGKRVDAIEAEADRIMLDRYGDPLTDGTIEAEAMEAIHNDQQAQKNVAEARQMAAQLGRDTRGMSSRLYRQRARMMLGRMTVREAAQPARFLAAERRSGRDAERAFAKVVRGDSAALAVALQAKEQQILNAALYDLSREAETEVAKARERMQGYGKKSVREKLEGGYIEQIDDLLDRYDFRQRGPGQVAKTERLRDFMDRMIAEGREAELMIDPRMMDEARRVHYSRLPLDEFRGLTDTIANLDHLGRFKQKLINGKKQRELAAVADSVAKAIEKNVGTGRIKQESRVRSFLDLVFTADTVLVDMDGGDEFGASYQAIKEDIDAGYVRVDEMNKDLSEKLDALFSVYSAREMREMRAEKHISGTRFTWPKWKAIAVALNTGNDDNVARLLAENAHPEAKMTREDLDAVLATLDKRDWDFVQSMWDLVNSYWPEIEAVTQRRTGVKPGKVEARQVQTAHGTYRGGYYPIRYDAGLGHAAAVDARTEMDRFMSAGRFAKAQTKHGHTIERKANGNGRSLNLDMDVAFAHLRDVIRDIALSEAVDNAHRVLNHNQVAQAFMEAGRKNDLDMMNLWLKDVAQGPIVHTDVLNQFARIVKNNFTLSRLALNLKTVILQTTGIAQSAATVGKRNMARAFADYLRRPQEASREVLAKSAFMQRRQTTFDKDIQDFASDTMLTSPMRGRVAGAMDIAARVGFAPMVKTQFYAVDVPTWMAGYRTGLRKFDGDEARAVSFADRMVARAQGSGAMPDRSALSRGTVAENARQLEWVRLFTTLQGYLIAKFNRGYLTARQGVRDVRSAETPVEKFAATADMAANLMLIYVAEAAMMGLLYAAMAAGDDDEDLSAEKFAGWLAFESAGTVIGGLPLARDGWAMLQPYATGGGVYGSVMDIPARVVQQIAQGENDKALRRAIADTVGITTGLPTVAAMRPIEEMLEDEGGSVLEALMGRNPLVD